MSTATQSKDLAQPSIRFDWGTFEGFNLRSQSAIERKLTAADVIAWDHNQQGDAEFRPSGDRPEVALLFQGRKNVTARELLHFDWLLNELGGASIENFLRVRHAVNQDDYCLEDLTPGLVSFLGAEIYLGTDSHSLRWEAGEALFQRLFPGAHSFWRSPYCEGFSFDAEAFLNSQYLVEEVKLGSQLALVLEPRGP